jgi:hypothetical protein
VSGTAEREIATIRSVSIKHGCFLKMEATYTLFGHMLFTTFAKWLGFFVSAFDNCLEGLLLRVAIASHINENFEVLNCP